MPSVTRVRRGEAGSSAARQVSCGRLSLRRTWAAEGEGEAYREDYERDCIEEKNYVASDECDHRHAQCGRQGPPGVVGDRVHLDCGRGVCGIHECGDQGGLHGQAQGECKTEGQGSEHQCVDPEQPCVISPGHIQRDKSRDALGVIRSVLVPTRSATTAAQGLTSTIPANCAEVTSPTVKTECVTS